MDASKEAEHEARLAERRREWEAEQEAATWPIARALAEPNLRVLVVVETAQYAYDRMHADARMLGHLLGPTEVAADVMKVEVARRRIRLDNGSTILYVGGDRDHLGQRLQGSAFDVIYGAGGLPGGLADWLLTAGKNS